MRGSSQKNDCHSQTTFSAFGLDAYNQAREYRIELQEEFKVILLNRANEVMGVFELSKGGSAGTVVDLKLIFAVALKCNAHWIILCYNHPSNNLLPSQNDLDLTVKAVQAAEFPDLQVLDHLILTREGYYSFADEGNL